MHQIFWLWIPVAFVCVQTGLEIFIPYELKGTLHSEGGPHETLQFLLMSAAFVLAVSILFSIWCHPAEKPDRNEKWRLSIWVGFAALASLYVAGEEVSWGQHIFDWSTPEFWAGINDQNETNLHNTSSWLDQKPRLALLIGVAVGGLIIPALQRLKPAALPQQFTIIYPPAILSVTAALAIATNLIDKLFEALTGYPLLSRGSEVEELYLFYFVLLYLVVLRRRIAQPETELDLTVSSNT